MKNILNPECSVIYYWYDHLVLRDNGDAKIITEAIIKGDFETFCRIKNKYPTKKYYHKEFGECDLVYFPNYASIFYNDEIIGKIDITTELGFSFITESEFECG